ncbi:hypothetical protein HZA87_05140 [Candidatus Uhrbacteria bacterium]|nr:hypothetical protein [Candidatus Uhrbacteria bacterium]
MKLLLILLIFITLFPTTVFAYSSNICTTGSTCASSEVGVFMQGISLACGNTGDCTLNDIMLVFVNTGNYVVGLIGGIVLLMYIVGGVYFLTSAGNTERVTKGKKYLSISTIGLLIVMFSYLGIYALRGVLQGGTFSVSGEYVACTGTDANEGAACDLNSTCVQGLCLSQCEQDHKDSYTYDSSTQIASYYACVDKTHTATSQSTSTDGTWYTGTCQTNLCPGGASTQCCQLNRVQSSE